MSMMKQIENKLKDKALQRVREKIGKHFHALMKAADGDEAIHAELQKLEAEMEKKLLPRAIEEVQEDFVNQIDKKEETPQWEILKKIAEQERVRPREYPPRPMWPEAPRPYYGPPHYPNPQYPTIIC